MVAGSLQAETAGGSIRAETVNGDVSAATSGGSIHLGKVGGSVDAETAGGSIYVGSAPGGVSAETAGGEIELENVSGAVKAANAAGSIRARFVGGHPLRNSLLETNSGTIVVWIPANLAVNVDATVDLAGSLSRIESEFADLIVRRESDGFGPATVTAAGPLNGGGPVLTIRNISGRIQIRKGQ
jgi:hypothetical protein